MVVSTLAEELISYCRVKITLGNGRIYNSQKPRAVADFRQYLDDLRSNQDAIDVDLRNTILFEPLVGSGRSRKLRCVG